MSRPYVGLALDCTGRREVFRADATPTPGTHPQFGAVIGPFRTMRAARLMADVRNNPHILCVADAERIARTL